MFYQYPSVFGSGIASPSLPLISPRTLKCLKNKKNSLLYPSEVKIVSDKMSRLTGTRESLELASLIQMVIFKPFTVTNNIFAPSLLWIFELFSKCSSVLFSDMAEQYFQESMTHVKDSEGAGRVKFLSIQDEFCNFLQITGQKEVSEFRSQLSSYSYGMPKTTLSAFNHLLNT